MFGQHNVSLFSPHHNNLILTMKSSMAVAWIVFIFTMTYEAFI